MTCVGALDPDDGANKEISYAFDSAASDQYQLPFKIDASSGCLFVSTDEPFDFEKRSFYNLSIEVSR